MGLRCQRKIPANSVYTYAAAAETDAANAPATGSASTPDNATAAAMSRE
jgi:hypothetical protein